MNVGEEATLFTSFGIESSCKMKYGNNSVFLESGHINSLKYFKLWKWPHFLFALTFYWGKNGIWKWELNYSSHI